jgi:hypothetical protein
MIKIEVFPITLKQEGGSTKPVEGDGLQAVHDHHKTIAPLAAEGSEPEEISEGIT